MNTNIRNPTISLLCKLGSLAVHAEELLSDDGHTFDRAAILALLEDGEVAGFLEQMQSMALLPVKRKS